MPPLRPVVGLIRTVLSVITLLVVGAAVGFAAVAASSDGGPYLGPLLVPIRAVLMAGPDDPGPVEPVRFGGAPTGRHPEPSPMRGR